MVRGFVFPASLSVNEYFFAACVVGAGHEAKKGRGKSNLQLQTLHVGAAGIHSFALNHSGFL